MAPVGGDNEMDALENNQLPSNEVDVPYKATMLWRAAVHGFREGMVVQRHWRHLRSYERCFTGQAAVSWLHNYLSRHPSFASNVTRQQTVRLLAKFTQAGIIVPVRPPRRGPLQFRDDSQLYRLSTHGTPGRSAVALAGGGYNQPAAVHCGNGSPELRRRTAESPQRENVPPPQHQQQQKESFFRPAQPRPQLSDRPQPPRPLQARLAPQLTEERQQLNQLPECRPVARQLSQPEADLVWSTTLLARLESLLDAPLEDIVATSCVVPAWVRHNISSVDERGLVVPLAATQPSAPPPLPRWLLLAMKSLAYWPVHQTIDAPPPAGDYASFQSDVLCVISEYFAALPFPLVPYELCDPLLAAFLHAESVDRQLRQRPALAACDAGPGSGGGDCGTVPRQDPPPPLAPASRSVENLLLLMSPSSSSTPRDTAAACATPASGEAPLCRLEQHSVLRAGPVPVTPARESVAMLRRRLMQLGVGAASEDVQNSGTALQRRPRAASFLRAVADGRQRLQPRGGDQFCRAVFQPPLDCSQDPTSCPRQSSGHVGAPDISDAQTEYPLPSPISLQPPPPVVPTRLYPGASRSWSGAEVGFPPKSATLVPENSDQRSATMEINRRQASRSEYLRYQTASARRGEGRLLSAAAQEGTYDEIMTLQPRRQVHSTSDWLSNSHQTSSSLGIRGLLSSSASLLSVSHKSGSSPGYFPQGNGRGAEPGLPASRLLTPPVQHPEPTASYRPGIVDDDVFNPEQPSNTQLSAYSYHSTDEYHSAKTSLHSRTARSSVSSVLSGSDGQRAGSGTAGCWPSSSSLQPQCWSAPQQQRPVRPSAPGPGPHRLSSGLSSASATADAGLMSDSAVGSSVTSERPVDVEMLPERRGEEDPPADTCLETVFGAAEPVTRVIRQRSVELLHLPQSRPGSRLSQATVAGGGSAESVRGRTALQNSIRRHQLRDDSLSRSVKRLKERRRDKQELKRRREQQEQQQSASADYAAFSSGLSHASEDSALAVPMPARGTVDSLAPVDGAAPAYDRGRVDSLASEDGVCAGRPSAAKAARLLGTSVEQVDRSAVPTATQWRGPAALRVWQRRSVADPSRVTQPPLSPLQQAARQRLSVVTRDYENISAVSGLLSAPGSAATGSTAQRPVYYGRFRATPRKRARSPPPAPELPSAHGTHATDLETAAGHKLARESLQLLLTLLPPRCRRQLQLLLRFMHRVTGNRRLQLPHPAGARELMLDTFAARILRPCGDGDWDAAPVRRLVGYLLDHQAEILAPPLAVRDAVRQRIRCRQRETVQLNCDEPVTYSNLVSLESYGRETAEATSQSLLSLLDVIIADTNMPRKEKRKKLKQFRETYPEIYGRRVQEADRELQTAGGGRRTRSLLPGPLNSLVRSKSLRI